MRADRLLSMLMLLQTRGRMTAEDLAGRLEVSTRTIYRDLDALSLAGVPVYSERGPNGGIALLDDYRTNLTGLTKNEVRSLFMFTVPALLADLKADKTQAAANLKLVAALPAPFQKDVAWVRQRIHMDPAGWFHPTEAAPFLSTVQEAVWQNRRLRMFYRRGDGNWVRRLVNPLGLVAKAGVWYMVGHVTGFNMVYRVSRIQEAALTDSSFNRPPDFDLVACWDEWCASFEQRCARYTVTVLASPEAIPVLVQSFGEWVHALVARATPNDRGQLELTFTFESPDAACRQLLAVGSVVEIIKPQELRNKMFIQAANLAALYATKE